MHQQLQNGCKNWGETNETWFGLTWWCPLLLEVDMDKAISQRMETSATDLRRQFRENKIKFNNLALNNNVITVQFADNADRDAAMDFYAVMVMNIPNRH